MLHVGVGPNVHSVRSPAKWIFSGPIVTAFHCSPPPLIPPRPLHTGSGSSHLTGAAQSAGSECDPLDRDDVVALYGRGHKWAWGRVMAGAAAGTHVAFPIPVLIGMPLTNHVLVVSLALFVTST